MSCSAGHQFGRVVAPLAILVSAMLLGFALPAHAGAAAAQGHPNVLIILTDDQRASGTVNSDVMPATKAWFRDTGSYFPEGYVTTPLCCPARASLLSGRYVHNHPVKDLDGTVVAPGHPDYAFHASTMEAYLRTRTNYRTAIYGKFLNGWDIYSGDGDGTDPPPFFDEYGLIDTGNYLTSGRGTDPFTCGSPIDLALGEACVNENGTSRELTTYSTHYVRDRALDFIGRREADDAQPWFLYLAPKAPHTPLQPEPKFAGTSVPDFASTATAATFSGGYRPPTCGTGDTSAAHIALPGKPAWVVSQAQRQCVGVGVKNVNHPDEIRNAHDQQLRMLRSVDEMVAAIFGKLEDLGEERDTLAFFLSDNGFMWGEHWQVAKTKPYTDSIRVPFYVRWPNATGRFRTDRFATNLDIAPTVLQAADVTPAPSDPKLDGRSLLDPTWDRQRLLTEHFFGNAQPFWASIRTAAHHYIETYANPLPDGQPFREYYDLVTDPDELTNLYGADGDPRNDPATDPPASVLSAQLAFDRACRGITCPPTGDTIKPRGLDVQTLNGKMEPRLCPEGPVEDRPDDCDKVVYTWSKPIDPASLVSGWDGTGTRTVRLVIDGDAGAPYGDPARRNDVVEVPDVPALGQIDLGRDDYVAAAPRSFSSSLLSMNADLTRATIVLDGGTVGAHQQLPGTMTWSGYDAVTDIVGNTAGPGAPRVTEGGAPDREF